MPKHLRFRDCASGGVQAVPFDQMVVCETKALVRALRARAPPSAQCSADSLAEWILACGHEHVAASDAPLVTTFCRMLRWYHRRAAALRRRGARILVQSFEASVPCGHADSELPYLAYVLPADAPRPQSLQAHALAEQREGAAAGEADTALARCVLFLHDGFAAYAQIAQHMCRLCSLKASAPGAPAQPTVHAWNRATAGSVLTCHGHLALYVITRGVVPVLTHPSQPR